MSSLRSRQSVPRWIWRWFAGRPLDGHLRTTSTFLRPGTKQLGPVPVRAWSYLPGWKRSAVRQVAGLSVPAVAWGYLEHHAATAAAGLSGLAVLLSVVVARTVRTARDWRHDRRYIRPLHAALSHHLDLLPHVSADSYINVPRTFAADPKTPAKVVLPSHFNASEENKRAIGGLFLQKLGMSAASTDVEFRTVGQPVMLAVPAPRPPGSVPLALVLDAINACEPSEIVLGMAPRDRLFKASFADESPHWAASCESGTGKSSLLQLIAAQVVRQHPDNRVVAIDPKRASLVPVAGLPGVTIHANPIGAAIEEMWAGVHDVAAEVMRRSEVLAGDPTAEFPMLALLIDEVNMLAALSRVRWDMVRPKGARALPPFWTDLLIILAAGRQFRTHAVIVGQDLRESALGGIGLRSMLGLRAIAGYDAQMWGRFIQTRPIPPVQPGAGRWLYSMKGRQTWVQNAFGTPAEIVDLGRCPMSHVPAEPQVSAWGTPEVGQGSGTSWVVGLESGAAVLGVSVEAFRKRRQRAGWTVREARQGNQPAWLRADLEAVRQADRIAS